MQFFGNVNVIKSEVVSTGKTQRLNIRCVQSVPYMDKETGEFKERKTYFTVTMFGSVEKPSKAIERISKYQPGTTIMVQGEVRTNEKRDDQGKITDVYTNLVADRITYVTGPRKKSESTGAEDDGYTPQDAYEGAAA